MSREIEDLVRSGYDRFNVGEREAPPDLWHPDGEFINSRDDPDPGTHRGLDAITQQNQRWVASYPDLRVEPLEIRPNGERVFVWVRFSGHGAGSGVPIDMELAHVWTVENGKIRRIEEYNDRAEALEAVALQGQHWRVEAGGVGVPQENVEVVRRFWETVATRGLEAAVDEFTELLAQDIEWHVLLPDGTYRGREAVLKFMGEFQEAFSEYQVEAEEFFDAGDKVVVVLRERARGKSSGAESEHLLIQVSTFRDGQIARIEEYSDRSEAGAAAGLREDPEGL